MRPRAYALLSQESLHCRGPAGTQRDVVLARATLVGMALNGNRVLRILVKPHGLLLQDALRLAGQRRAVDLEMNEIPDIGGKILSCPRRRATDGADAIFLGQPLTRAHAARTMAMARTPAILQARLTQPLNPITGYSRWPHFRNR